MFFEGNTNMTLDKPQKLYQCECGNSKVEILSVGDDKTGWNIFVCCPVCKKVKTLEEANKGWIWFDCVDYDEEGNIIQTSRARDS